uniref:Uncharacterized protein n=1 Tax=Mimivirus LCMiAC01 TaxID=2506608 RepID=A0A481YZJ7_9VIRU|nr:MAG: hypothetical protein LCMiAC01_03500 [Mimivirus LCMiAC01]
MDTQKKLPPGCPPGPTGLSQSIQINKNNIYNNLINSIKIDLLNEYKE